MCANLPTPVVFVREGAVFANSRDVAELFEKEHKNVLQSIDALVTLEASLAGLTFQLSSYRDPTGRTLRSFDMTRDGFTLLAMGFTGPKALRFKLAYIEAFNRMEAEVSRPLPRADLSNPSGERERPPGNRAGPTPIGLDPLDGGNVRQRSP